MVCLRGESPTTHWSQMKRLERKLKNTLKPFKSQIDAFGVNLKDLKSDADSLYFDGKIQGSDVLLNFDFQKKGKRYALSRMSVDIDGYGAGIDFSDFQRFLTEYQLIAYFEPQKISNAWASMDLNPKRAERFFESLTGVDDFSAWSPRGDLV